MEEEGAEAAAGEGPEEGQHQVQGEGVPGWSS